jgi:23S rRNA (adenine2030-N6)-methyltransferase
MVVVNPPYTLEEELRTVFPALRKLLALEAQSRWALDRLTGEVHSA